MSLKILRGLLINLPAVLDAGRLAVTEDTGTERLYVGVPSGNLRISTYPDLTAGLATLEGSPPFSLNTLEKLANSINDDASYHSTVDAAISNKASLAQLASKADLSYVDANIATIDSALALKADIVDTVTNASLFALAYVDSPGAQLAAATDTIVRNASSLPSLSVTQAKVLLYYGGGNVNFTANLPAVTIANPVGWAFQLFKPSGAATAVTFVPNGSDTINGVAGNYLGLDADRSYILIKSTATDWRLQVLS
jgi:hypothetical protein